MKSSVLPYLEISKQNVKRKISVILTDQKIKEVANAAFDFHFKDRNSLAFQAYYCEIVSNREAFLSTPEAALHLNDQKFLQRVRRWYNTKQWDSSLKKGEKIVEIIMQHKSINPQAVIPILVECLNVLKQGIVKFELNRWEHKPKGNHTEHVAVIRILPNTWK